MKEMRAFFQSPLSWLALFCAALSVGLWEWSRRLPESHWEATAAAAPETASSPEPASAQENPPGETTPAPTASPSLSTASSVQPAPSPAPETLAAPSPAPEPVPAASPAPAPSDAALTGPLPANPEPAASAPLAPSPAPSVIPPAPLDFAEIARQPELWPKQVVLLGSVRFPVILNGVNVGNIQMPPGRAVLLRKVNFDGTVEIELQGSQASHAKVKAQVTDLLARAQAVAAARKSAAPTP